MQLWQTIQTEQNCKVGMSAGGLPRPLMEDSGGPTTNWLRTIQIDNASNGHISSSQASHGGQAAGMSALLPFVRQYAFSNPNFGSSTAGGNSAPGSATTTTTRHFAAWEQTTTHFPSPPTPQQPQNLGQHTHPALLASVNLKASPVIRPIPSRLNTSPGPKPELLGPPLKPPPVKLETRPLFDVTDDNQDSSKAENDSAFEDWQESCSRTTPINHKSIKKWRQKSQPGGGSSSSYSASSSSSSIQPISIMTSSSPLEVNGHNNGGGPLSAPSVIHSWQQQNRPGSAGFSSPNDSLFTSPASSHSGDSSCLKRRLKSETMTSPDSVSSLEDSKSNIPVGIAVARQRNETVSKSTLEDSGIEMKRPLPPPPPPPRPPTSSEQAAFVESWLRQPQLWPLSYPAAAAPISGYQFVKDPLTGQMFFVPSPFGTPHPHLSAAVPPTWPPPPAAHAASAANPSAAAAAFASLTPFQQSLMQLQQESLMVRQGFLFNQPRPLSPTRPTAPPPASVTSASEIIPEVKVNGATLSEIEEEEQLSVGDETEVKIKVKEEVVKSENGGENNGLHLLTEGIDRLESRHELKSKPSTALHSPSKLGLLCDAAFLSDDEHHLKSENDQSQCKVRSRSLDMKERRLSSDYRSPKAERNAKAFIASKSLKVCEDLKEPSSSSSPSKVAAAKDYHQPLQHPRGSEAAVKMDDWERKMRSDLASIQKKYKEKYKELYKLQHKSITSPIKKVEKNPGTSSSVASNKVNHHTTKKTLAPISPWLQTFKLKVNGQHTDKVSEPMKNQQKKSNSVVTPNGKESKLGPDLSVITSKFRSARPNPFENLLKLSGKKSEVSTKNEPEEVEEDVIDDEDKPLMTSTPKFHVLKNGKAGKKENFLLSHSNDLNNKSLPKLHLANNNKVQDHVVDEDNEEAAAVEADISDEEDDEDDAPMPVLEPMQELPSPSSNATASVVGSVASKQPQQNITVKIKRPPSPPSSPKTKKSKKEKKAKKAKKEHRHHHHHKKHHKKQSVPITVHVNDDSKAPADCIDLLPSQTASTGKNKAQNGSLHDRPSIDRKVDDVTPNTCVIKEEDLVQDLRVLVKLDGHFHPGKIQAISPPDIYGVLVDKERGNKPHIFSREEVLREAIFEVKPPTMQHLVVGTRVCAYWSQKYHHLYPGTISDMEIDPKLSPNDYVNVELDDGDNRDIHVNSIRFLPSNYPLVVYDPDPLMSTLSRRKRRQSWESGTSEGSRATKTPRASFDSEISPPPQYHPQPLRNNHHHVHAGDLKMRIHVPTTTSSGSSIGSNLNGPSKQRKSSNGGSQNEAVASNLKAVRKLAQRPSISSSSDSEDGKGGIASFLPKDQVWKWADKGQKRSKGRVYHKVIERKDERLGIGDSAVFLSTNCPDQPYIGRLESMWETASGTKNVGVRWYYHLAEIECSDAEDKQNIKKIKHPKGALFESNHYDENDVQTISNRCDVQSFGKYLQPNQDHDTDNDKYYLAGTHNAIEKTVQFATGVLSCD